MSTGGEVANALVCKTSIRGFNSLPVLQEFSSLPRALFCVRKNKPQIFPLSGHKRIGRQRNRTSAAKAGYRSTLYGTAEAVP
jgi:hypothetical protein